MSLQMRLGLVSALCLRTTKGSTCSKLSLARVQKRQFGMYVYSTDNRSEVHMYMTQRADTERVCYERTWSLLKGTLPQRATLKVIPTDSTQPSRIRPPESFKWPVGERIAHVREVQVKDPQEQGSLKNLRGMQKGRGAV